MDNPRAADSLIAGFKALKTPSVSDALDRLGIAGGCLGLMPLVPGLKVVGPAFTVRYVPVGVVKGTVGDYIDDVEAGHVVVLDNGGRTHCTVWGDLLTLTAHRRGVAGTVIDGVCRDMRRIRDLSYPVFARGFFMVTGKDRVQVDAVNATVSIGGVQVKPGDIIVGDDSGVVVVPLEKAEDVLTAAQKINTAEVLIEKAVLRGERLDEARKRHGYHRLQARR